MIKIGVDIGGTFTDAIAMDVDTGRFWTAKVPTTYPDPADGFLNALNKLIVTGQLSWAEVDWIIHGTTLVTNAILERKGGPVGLITSEGFGDTLWIRTERRYDLFDVMIDFPEPLVDRWRVVEVPERVLYDGSVFTVLDEDAVIGALDHLIAADVNAVAVCLLHSYSNDKHEQRILELIADRYPNMRASISSEVWPESGEYHRMSTTVANAYVQPVVDKYLDQLTSQLARNGFRGKFYLMLSNGGSAAVSTGRKFPIQLIESGPAAGVLAATYLTERTGNADVLSFDMGGTTAKLSLIEAGKPLTADLIEAGRIKRHMPGSGIPIKVPVIDLLEIGSGGGSIAWIDHMGLLKVGPESAGSSPGPACYGWGGLQPTVTDADLLLGYLNPDSFLGGEMKLDKKASWDAMEREIASKTGLSVLEAARGVYEVVNQSMALAAKMHVLERGKDPTHYALVAYGGAGPVHAYGVGLTLGVKEVIIPPNAGVAASLGLLAAPVAFDLVQTMRLPLQGCPWEQLHEGYSILEKRGREILAQANVPDDQIRYTRTADMRYSGQGYDVTAPIPAGLLDDNSLSAIVHGFEDAYRERFAHLPAMGQLIEIARLRVRVSADVVQPNLPVLEESDRHVKPSGFRGAYFSQDLECVNTPVYQWMELVPGQEIPGPLIVETENTTVVVGPHGTMSMNSLGYLTIRLQGDR